MTLSKASKHGVMMERAFLRFGCVGDCFFLLVFRHSGIAE
jgi:hypothetical protein